MPTTSETKSEKQEANKQQIQNITDTSSFNAFCILELPNGQTVSTQLTFRHGIPEELYFEDFQKWYRILSKISQDGGDKPYARFWDGGKVITPVAPAQAAQPDKPDNGKKEYPNEFKAGRLTASSDKGKIYFKVEGEEGAKFPKFPVTIWPEVIEKAGINADEIPVKGMALTGWIAVYEKNEKGYPGKVIELRQPDFMKD